MKLEIITQEKNLIEVKTDNVTIAEILRVYLNNQGIKFAAWRKEHPTKPIIFRIESSGKTIKKAISEAVIEINKELDTLTKFIKK